MIEKIRRISLFDGCPLLTKVAEKRLDAGSSPKLEVTSLNIDHNYYLKVEREDPPAGKKLAELDFSICLQKSIGQVAGPNSDCDNAILVTCETKTTGQSSLSGIGTKNEVSSDNSCLKKGERQSIWYKFTFATAGTFIFTINPDYNIDDFDFALFDITGGCDSKGSSIRCSYYGNYNGAGNTGLNLTETDLSEAAGGNGFVKYLDVVSNKTYALLLDNFDKSGKGYSLTFGGTARFTGNLPTPQFTFSPNPTCQNATVSFTNQSTNAVSYSWNFGDGTPTSPDISPTHSYATPGTFNVSLTTTNNCGSSAVSYQITVNPISNPCFTINGSSATSTTANNCQGIILNGSCSTNEAKYFLEMFETDKADASGVYLSTYKGQWFTGTPGSIDLRNFLNSAGGVQCGKIYKVKLAVNNNCTSWSQTVKWITYNCCSVTADFSMPSSVCNGNMVSFTNLTNTCFGLANTYSWNFGDGQTIISYNPYHTFINTTNAITTYAVTLTSSGTCGTSQISKSIDVNPSPGLTLTTTPGTATICLGANATLTATGTANQYLWSNGATTSTITVSPSISTKYIVTATNLATGCSSTLNQTINVIPNTIMISPSETNICAGSGQSVTITAGGLVSYSWSTGATTSSITVSPTLTTIYTVTGTSEITGCINSKSATVNVLTGPPVASFSFNPYNNVEGETITFQNTSTNATGATFTWDFMNASLDAITHNNDPTSHVFSGIDQFIIGSGYFQISLSGTNACGTSNDAQNIYIIPSVGDYAPTFNCLNNFSYNYTDLDIINTSTNASTLNNTGGVTYIKGTLTIKAGKKLYLNNNIIAFGPQGKVIVERGALLSLTNTSKLTGIEFSSCNGKNVIMMWQGINVWGNANSNVEGDQGKIDMYGSTIEDAYNGVILGKTELIKTSDYAFQRNGHDNDFGGGIIKASSITFNRCLVGVKFFEYPYQNNRSIIQNCSFICKDVNGNNGPVLDPHFLQFGSDKFYHNPFYGGNDDVAFVGGYLLGRTLSSIFLYGVKTVSIRDNYFENADVMVYSTNAKFNLGKGGGNGNTFTNSFRPVYVNNALSYIEGSEISNNNFIKFKYAITLKGSKSYLIQNNKFNLAGALPENAYNNFDHGLQLEQSTNFSILDNKFKLMLTGIESMGSGTSASLIGFKSTGNSFTRCKTPIITQGSNEMLNIRCNEFINTTDTDYSGKNWDINDANVNGKFLDQGKASSPASEKDPAGNIFNKLNPTKNKEIDAHLSSSFLYYPHTTDFTIPTKYTGTSKINIQPGLVPFTNVNAACMPSIIIGPCVCEEMVCKCKEKILLLQEEIEQLNSEFHSVEQSLDKGNTLDLLTAIQGNTPVSQLRDKLVNNSPLSDVVLTALYNRSVPLPPQVFQDIMLPNSPVSEKNNQGLQDKLQNFPPDIAEKLRNAQVINPPYRTLTTIQRERDTKENERQLILNDAVRYYVGIDALHEAIDLLEQETSKEAKQGLVATYIDERNFTAASAKLNTLSTNSTEDKAFVDLYRIYIDLGLANKSLWEMDGAQLQKVKEIAALCPASLATINARAVLAMISVEDIPSCPEIEPVAGLRKYIFHNEETENLNNDNETPLSPEFEYLGNNIPNPFDGSTFIPYYIPAGSYGILNLLNITGGLIKSYSLNEGKNFLEVSLKEFSNGIYIYNLSLDGGKIIKYKKMVLNR